MVSQIGRNAYIISSTVLHVVVLEFYAIQVLLMGISQVAIIISMLNLPMCKKIARNTVLKVPMTGEGLIIEHFI